jgi:exodeoxyribonuclease-3
MIIASFNCNSIRARMPVLNRWLDTVSPDVLCLQETKVQDKDFPVEELLASGYNSVFMGEKSYNGVAILAKEKMIDPFYGFDGKGEDEGTRLIAVKIGHVNIVNTYVPQGTSPDSEKFQYKLDWFSRLENFFRSGYNQKEPLIWLGDFNVAPDPIDVHNPKRLLGNVGYHPDEHAALAKVKSSGFTDVFRKHCTDEGQYSFWDYRAKDGVAKGLGWRVDHIWGNQSAAEKSTRSWIDREPRLWEKPSDHTPILAEFNF